jgi:hypothetical protein
MKTKMKFSDITNVIERDEMKKIMGGSGKPVPEEEDIIQTILPVVHEGGTDPFQFRVGAGFGNLPPGQLSTPIPGTTDSFYGESLSGVVVGGNYSNSSFGGTFGAVAFGWDTKTMLSQLAAGGDAAGDLAGYFKYVEGVGIIGLAVGAGITTNDAMKNGWHDYHIAELGTQAMIFTIGMSIPVAGWALGAAYFAADYYSKQNYGEGLYQHLNPN